MKRKPLPHPIAQPPNEALEAFLRRHDNEDDLTRSPYRPTVLIHGRAIGATHARLARRWVSRLASTVAPAASSADSPEAVALPILQQVWSASVGQWRWKSSRKVGQSGSN